MSRKEYPKALYKDGKPEGDFVSVEDQEAEAEASRNGYRELQESSFKHDELMPKTKQGESTALVDPVKTTLAAEKPEEGNIYATSGSAPTPDFPFPDEQKTVEKITRPVGRPPKNKD